MKKAVSVIFAAVLFMASLSACLAMGADNITVHTLSLKKGDSIFIPAQNSSFKLNGRFEAVMSYV